MVLVLLKTAGRAAAIGIERAVAQRIFDLRADALSFAKQLLSCVVIIVALVGIGIAIFNATIQTDDPTRWVKYPGPPGSLKSLGFYTGAILGIGIGLSTAARWARFDAGGPMRLRILRVVLLAGPAALYWLRPKKFINNLLASLSEPVLFSLSFVGCAVAAWVFIFLVPRLFLKFGLAKERDA